MTLRRAARAWRHVLVYTILLPAAMTAQEWNIGWAEGSPAFRPLIAHTVEARMGMNTLRNEHRLRLDIGATADLLALRHGDGNTEVWTFGADFFTWTSLRQAADFHFPVDAVDYLFGVNISHVSRFDEQSALTARLRFSHISAHLVDGSYDKIGGAWRDRRLPRVYSREFLDLVVAYERNSAYRVYAGALYLVHVDPPHLGRFAPHGGIEVYPISFADGNVTPYVAYDGWLVDIGAYAASHSVQAGVCIGRWGGRGVNLFLSWFSGNSEHGEYHDLRWTTWGYGFTVTF